MLTPFCRCCGFTDHPESERPVAWELFRQLSRGTARRAGHAPRARPGPQLPGEELKGKSAALLRHVADHATADAEALERFTVGDLRIDTDGQAVHAIVQGILRRTGFLDQPRAAKE